VIKIAFKFLDPYRENLHMVLDILAIVALGFATYGAFVSDVWLASTQWLLVSLWLLIASTHVRRG
jgi:hypothetical protein